MPKLRTDIYDCLETVISTIPQTPTIHGQSNTCHDHQPLSTCHNSETLVNILPEPRFHYVVKLSSKRPILLAQRSHIVTEVEVESAFREPQKPSGIEIIFLITRIVSYHL